MSAALVLGASFTSCSNEVSDSPKSEIAAGKLLVKSPEMIAYSGGHLWNEYGTKGETELEETEVVKPYVSNNDVEINLSINAKAVEPGITNEDKEFDKDYIYSHLTLHVRTVSDVEIRIPVPADYYCPADDLEIVKKHLNEHFVYGDQNHTLSLNIDGNDVTVKVAYDENGFTITTDGINEEVISYLGEEYGDGITFEIWNYYSDTDREKLQALLNQSTVKFIESEENVDYYVNAFNELRVGEDLTRVPNDLDCTVSIDEAQAENFTLVANESPEYANGFHGYNGSNINKVYKHIRETEEEPEDELEQLPEE